MKTGKSRKKYDSVKATVVKQLAKSFEISESYVRMALRGDKNNQTTDQVKKEYTRLYKALENILNK